MDREEVFNQRKEKAKEASIVLVAGLVPLSLKKEGNYYTFKEHDSVVIDPNKNCFWHNSVGVSGDTIGLLQHFCGCSYNEAVDAILDLTGDNDINLELLGFSTCSTYSKPDEEGFKMPDIAVDKDGNVYTKDVEQYLSDKRCISTEVVKYFINTNRLFQQSIRMKKFTRGRFKSCCLFVNYPDGKSENLEPVFCERRTIFPGKAGERKTLTVSGSDKKFGYYINHFAPTLVVTEGILDFMAIMSILQNHNQNFCGYDYLALTGTGKVELIANILQAQPHIKNVILSFDNDDAGDIATNNAVEILKKQFPLVKYKIKRPPKAFKDYNDFLIAVSKKNGQSQDKTA